MTALALLQLGSGTVLYLAFAWLVACLSNRLCLNAGADAVAERSLALLQRSAPVAAVLCLGAGVVALYAASATMSGLPLSAAWRVVGVTLSQTAVGRNTGAGLLTMMFIALLACYGSRQPVMVATGLMLALFAFFRVTISHAAEHGVLSVAFAMEWLHLMLTALWTGIVLIAAWVVLPQYRPRQPQSIRPDRYLWRLSALATAAFMGIVLSGLYNVWLRVGSLANLCGNSYSTVLLIKGGMVLLALFIGAYNRYIGFPAVVSRGSITPGVLLLLRVESGLLVAALGAAVSLTLMEPPSSA